MIDRDVKPEVAERIDYYHIPEDFRKYIRLENRLIFTRYKFAADHIGNNSDLLEIGCGFGSGSKLLGDLGSLHKSYTGIDLSPDSVNIANQEYAGHGKFFKSDAESLSIFQNKSFDNVISFENIEHLRNPRNSFFEIFRVLKTDGKLILSTPNRRNWGLADNNPYHFRHYTWCQIISEAEECGFDLVKGSGIYFSPSNFRLAVGFSVLGIDIKKAINDVPLFLNLFFFLGKLFPRRSRILLFVFKKREHFPIEKYKS